MCGKQSLALYELKSMLFVLMQFNKTIDMADVQYDICDIVKFHENLYPLYKRDSRIMKNKEGGGRKYLQQKKHNNLVKDKMYVV
jgi:hypothetical protein